MRRMVLCLHPLALIRLSYSKVLSSISTSSSITRIRCREIPQLPEYNPNSGTHRSCKGSTLFCTILKAKYNHQCILLVLMSMRVCYYDVCNRVRILGCRILDLCRLDLCRALVCAATNYEYMIKTRIGVSSTVLTMMRLLSLRSLARLPGRRPPEF